jgi:hypothetical protein
LLSETVPFLSYARTKERSSFDAFNGACGRAPFVSVLLPNRFCLQCTTARLQVSVNTGEEVVWAIRQAMTNLITALQLIYYFLSAQALPGRWPLNGPANRSEALTMRRRWRNSSDRRIPVKGSRDQVRFL